MLILWTAFFRKYFRGWLFSLGTFLFCLSIDLRLDFVIRASLLRFLQFRQRSLYFRFQFLNFFEVYFTKVLLRYVLPERGMCWLRDDYSAAPAIWFIYFNPFRTVFFLLIFLLRLAFRFGPLSFESL